MVEDEKRLLQTDDGALKVFPHIQQIGRASARIEVRAVVVTSLGVESARRRTLVELL